MPHSPKCIFWAKLSLYLCVCPYSSNSFCCFLLSCFAARPSSLCLRFVSCLTLVKRTLLLTCFVCAALLLFGCLVFPCMCCPVGLVGLCRLCAPAVSPRRLSGFLRSSLCLCGPCCFLCCLPSFVVVPVSVLSAFLPPRVVLFVFWSSLHPGVLVPPSGYLVAAVTAQLPCRCARSVVVLCRPSFILSHGSKGS